VRSLALLTVLLALLSLSGCALPPWDLCAMPRSLFTGWWDGWNNSAGPLPGHNRGSDPRAVNQSAPVTND
jgi:hypothetical protein